MAHGAIAFNPWGSLWIHKFVGGGVVAINNATPPIQNSQTPSTIEAGWNQAIHPHMAGLGPDHAPLATGLGLGHAPP